MFVLHVLSERDTFVCLFVTSIFRVLFVTSIFPGPRKPVWREREIFSNPSIPNNSNTHTSFGAWSPVHARARRADRVAR